MEKRELKKFESLQKVGKQIELRADLLEMIDSNHNNVMTIDMQV